TATFGLAVEQGPRGAHSPDGHPGHLLRVRLADRSPGMTNPALGLLADLLDLADGRVTASEILDLAAGAPVRTRFRFSDDDLERIREWPVAAGVHWREDLGRRARFGLPDLRQGPWDVALDRILLGAAMAEEDHRFVGPALPMDDVDSTDIDLAGRLAEFIDRLTHVLDTLDGARPLEEWLTALDHALTLLADAPQTESWQLVQARRILADVRTSPSTHEALPRRLPDARALLPGRLDARPTRRPPRPLRVSHRRPAHRPHGPEAGGAAPRRRAARWRRRRLPPLHAFRRRRHPAARAVPRRARPPQRGPAALPRRRHGRRG